MDLDTLLVAVGGGGLLAGLAAWYGRRVRLIGVEPRECPALHAARAAGEPVDVRTGGRAADSLGCRRVGMIAFPIVQQFAEDVLLVSEEAIVESQNALWEELRVIAELGGAVALAALLSGTYRPACGERVGIVICGANTDPATISPRMIARRLAVRVMPDAVAKNVGEESLPRASTRGLSS